MGRAVWQCDISVDGLQQYAAVGTVGLLNCDGGIVIEMVWQEELHEK